MMIDDPTWIQVCIALFANPNADADDRAPCWSLLENAQPFMSLEAVILCSVGLLCLTYMLTHWPRRRTQG